MCFYHTQNTMRESLFTKGNEGGRREKKVEDREEVRRSVSDRILSPAYKRFNSLSPLNTLSLSLSNTAVSTCKKYRIYVVFTVYEWKEGENERNGSRAGFTFL